MQRLNGVFMDPLSTNKWVLFFFMVSQSTIYYSIESPNSSFITPHESHPMEEKEEESREKTIIMNDPQSIENHPLNNNKNNHKVTFKPVVDVQIFCRESYGLMENSLYWTNLKTEKKVLRDDDYYDLKVRRFLIIAIHIIIMVVFFMEFFRPVHSQSIEDVHYLYWSQMIEHQCQSDNWWLDKWNRTHQWNGGEVMVGFMDNGNFFRSGLLDNGTHSIYNISQYPSVNLNKSQFFSNHSFISTDFSQWIDKGFSQNFQRWVKTNNIQQCYGKIFNNQLPFIHGNMTAKIHQLSILTNTSDGSQYSHIIRGPHGNFMAIESMETHIINNISYDLMVGKAIDNGGFVVDDEKFLFSHLPLKTSLESGATQYQINYGNKNGTLRCNKWIKNRFKNCTMDGDISSQWMVLNNNNWFHGIMNMVGYGVNNSTKGQYTHQTINGWQWNSLKTFDEMEGYWESRGECNPLNIFSKKSNFQGLIIDRKDFVLKKNSWTTEDFLGTVDIPHWFMDLNWSANHTEKNSTHQIKSFFSGAVVFPKEKPQIITSCADGSYNSICYGPDEPLESTKVTFKNDNQGTIPMEGLGIQITTNPSDNQWIFRVNGIPWEGDLLRSKINGADIILAISSKFLDVYQWKTSNNCPSRSNEIYKNFLNINFVNNFLNTGVLKEKMIHINNNHFLNQSSFFFPIEIYNNPRSPLLWNKFGFDGQPVGCNQRCFVLDFNGFPQRVLERPINLPPLLDMNWTVHQSMVWHGGAGGKEHHCNLHWLWSNVNDYVFVCWVNPSQVRFIYKIKDESMWFPATTNGNFWNILLTNGETIAIEKTSGLGFNRGNNHRYPSGLFEKTQGPWLLGNGTFNQTIQGEFFNFKYPHEIILRSNFTFSPNLFDDHFQLKGIVYNSENNQYQLCQNDNFKNIFCFEGHWQWGILYYNFFNPNPTFLNKVNHHKWTFYQWLNGSQSAGYNFFPRTHIFTQSTSSLWNCKLIEFLFNRKFPMVLGQWCQRKNNNQINTVEIPLHPRWDHHINQWVASISHWFPCIGTANKCQFKLLNGVLITCDGIQCWNSRGLLNNNYIDRLSDSECIKSINKYINNTVYLMGFHPQKKYYFPSLINDKIHGIILEPMVLESIIYWNYYSYPLFITYVLLGLAVGLFYKWAQSLYSGAYPYLSMKKFFVRIHGVPFLALDILNVIIHSSIVFGPSAAMINGDQYRYYGSLNGSYIFTAFWMLWTLLELVWGMIILYNPWFDKFHKKIQPLVHFYGTRFPQKNKMILLKNLTLTIPRIIIQILTVYFFPTGEIFKVQNYKEINLPL
jgi:hypothetical protein